MYCVVVWWEQVLASYTPVVAEDNVDTLFLSSPSDPLHHNGTAKYSIGQSGRPITGTIWSVCAPTRLRAMAWLGFHLLHVR